MYRIKQIFFCSLLAHIALAQTDSTLQEVVVSEHRLQLRLAETARQVQIITKTQIQQMPATSLAEVLSYVSGVDVRQRGVHGVQADVNVRGGTFDQTLVLFNGIPLADPQTGHHLLNLPIDLSQIDRIEVLKGGAARTFGQNAFAGAINIVTKIPEQAQATLSAMGGHFNTWGIKAGAALPTLGMMQQLNFSTERSDGYRSKNSDYQIDNLFYQARQPLSVGHLQLMAGVATRKFGASGYYAPKDTSSEYEATQTIFAAAELPMTLGQWMIKPRFSWRKHEDDYQYYRYAPDLFRNQTTSHIFTAELHTAYKSKWGTTGLSLEARHINFESTRLGTHERTQMSIFAEQRIDYQRFTLVPGVMLTQYSDFGQHLFPGVDISYELQPNTRVYANYGMSYRVPTYTDLYFNNAANWANPNLHPEKANNYELGLKYKHPKIHAELAFFKRDGYDIIDRTKDSAHHKWLPTNLSRLSTEGIDFYASLPAFEAPQWSWIKNISIGVTYLTKTRLEKSVALSRYALDQLICQVNVGVQHQIWKRWSQTLRWRYLDRANLKNYNILDVKWLWIEKYGNVYLQATNLFNTAYTESNNIPMPGRWISLGASFKLVYSQP